MRGTRLRRALPAALGVVVLTATVALAAVSWPSATGAHQKVGPNWSWNYGSSMDKTGNGKIALVYSTDFVKGDWASDSGPYQGTYVTTGNVDGSTGAVTWSKGKLVSQGKKHSERPSLAAGGSNVYAIWVTQTSYDNYDGTKPRVAYVRVNNNNGAPKAWNAPIRLSPGKGQVDYPVVAASGNSAYVVYTNSKNGDMVVKRTTDAGANWTTKKVGTTTRVEQGEGLAGWPGICAAGSNVAVVWLGANNGLLNYAISTDGGANYSTRDGVANLGTGAGANFSWSQCDAVGARIGVTWTTTTGLKYREFNSGSNTWAAERTAATFTNSTSGTYKSGYGPAVALNGAGQVGLSWGDCKNLGCDYNKNVTRIDLGYIESGNNGAAWGPRQKLADSSVRGKTLNDSPNVLFWDADTRYIVYNGWTANYSAYRLYLTQGEGNL